MLFDHLIFHFDDQRQLCSDRPSRPLTRGPIEVLEIAVRVAILVLLEPGDSRPHGSTGTACHREQVVRRRSGPVSLGINSVKHPVGARCVARGFWCAERRATTPERSERQGSESRSQGEE